MESGLLFTVSAPSGAGKTRLVKSLVEQTANISISVSHTTRPMRPGEVDGEDYFFVDHAKFKQLIEHHAFLEYAEVFGNYYGTAQASVEGQLAAGQDVILEIDWQGAEQVRHIMSGAISIFILPPSREVLEQRLRDRGQDSEQVIAQRMAAAKSEIEHHKEADFLVVNDNFDQALRDLQAIIQAQRLSLRYQEPKLANLISNLMR